MFKVSFFDAPEKKFIVNQTVVLTGPRFKNVQAVIKELDAVNKIAIVKTYADESHRVDYSEMDDVVDIPELQNNSVKQDDEYRPVGVGTGKDRDAWNVAAQALKRLEKELRHIRVPVTAVKYESTDTKKWHNGFNTLWEGEIKIAVDFMDLNGVKHTATVAVPVKGGVVQQPEFMVDNLNRKYKLDKEGMQNFLQGINYLVEENKDESIYETPAQENPTVAHYVNPLMLKKSNSDQSKLIDLKYKYGQEQEGDVWKLESPTEESFSDELNMIANQALDGDESSQEFLEGIWDGESWESIKKKLETEGSVWYVWWMDGVRALMQSDSENKKESRIDLKEKHAEENIPEDKKYYKVVRYFKDDRKPKTILRGMSLEGAQAHCQSPETHGEDWFDGYTEDIHFIPYEKRYSLLKDDISKTDKDNQDNDNKEPRYKCPSCETIFTGRKWSNERRGPDTCPICRYVGEFEKISSMDLKEKLITAQNYMGIARKIMSPNDFENFRKLIYLRDIVSGEIEKQYQYNKSRGFEKGENVSYERLENVNRDIDNILEKYRNQISMTFQPAEAKNKMINKVLKKQADESEKQDDSEEEISPFKKRETKRKDIKKDPDEDLNKQPISPVEHGIGNREFSDGGHPDSHIPRFQS